MFENLKIYLMDLADVFVLLFRTEFVQTNKKIVHELFWGKKNNSLLESQSNSLLESQSNSQNQSDPCP